MAEAEVGNVRAMAGSDLVEVYDEALLVMARRETGGSSMTLDEAERWHHGQRVTCRQFAGLSAHRLELLGARCRAPAL